MYFASVNEKYAKECYIFFIYSNEKIYLAESVIGTIFFFLSVMSEMLYLQQTFTDCVSDQYTYFAYRHVRYDCKL